MPPRTSWDGAASLAGWACSRGAQILCFPGPWVSGAGALPGQPSWFPSLESIQRLMPAKKPLWVDNSWSLVLLQAPPEVVCHPAGSGSDECSEP